jgi:hypothetical protein
VRESESKSERVKESETEGEREREREREGNLYPKYAFSTCWGSLYSDNRTVLTNEHEKLFNLHPNHLICCDTKDQKMIMSTIMPPHISSSTLAVFPHVSACKSAMWSR